MNRRRYLASLGAGSVAALAGCTGLSSTDDGDDAPPPASDESDDSEDEPSDREVPSNGDESSNGDDSTADTEDQGPNPLDEGARGVTISADTDVFTDRGLGFPSVRSYVDAYSFDTVGVMLLPDCHVLESLDTNGEYRIRGETRRYPDGTPVGSGRSESFVPAEITAFEPRQVPIAYQENVVGDELSVLLSLVPDTEEESPVSRAVPRTAFAATDPFTVTESGIQSVEATHRRDTQTVSYAELDTREYHPTEGTYTMSNAEGGYFVHVDPTTPTDFLPLLFDVPFYVPKQVYARRTQMDRPVLPESAAQRTAYVAEARTSGIGQYLAAKLDEIAEFQGYANDSAKIEFFTTVVQSLPYALDSVGSGFGNHSRYPAETLVDIEADCVDTSILLAVILLESEVSADVVFLSWAPDGDNPRESGHLGVGVSPGTEAFPDAPYLEVNGQQFHYLESTGLFPVGEVPDPINLAEADVHVLG